MVDTRAAKKHKFNSTDYRPGTPTCHSPTHSVSDSNHYTVGRRNCYSKMTDGVKDPAYWNDKALQMKFAETLIAWKTDGKWIPTQHGKTNWYHLSLHMNSLCSVNLKWDQYQSKYYRWKDSWTAFKSLRGICGRAETGIGWDEERQCFIADPEQWAALCRENKKFKQFRDGKSCDVFLVLDHIFQSSTARGVRAVGSNHTGFVYEHDGSTGPLPAFNTALHTTHGHVGGASDPSLASFGGDQAATTNISRGKRPVSTVDDSPASGSSRGTKSSKSLESIHEVLTTFSRLSAMRIQERERRMHPDSDPYGMERFVEFFDTKHKLSPNIREACIAVFLGSRDARIIFMKSDDEYQTYWIMKQAGL